MCHIIWTTFVYQFLEMKNCTLVPSLVLSKDKVKGQWYNSLHFIDLIVEILTHDCLDMNHKYPWFGELKTALYNIKQNPISESLVSPLINSIDKELDMQRRGRY